MKESAIEPGINKKIVAVDKVNFEISGDEFFTMLGPSGCGKTTTLRMIAGLESITSGTVLFNGRDFSDFSAFHRHSDWLSGGQANRYFPGVVDGGELSTRAVRARSVIGPSLSLP